MDRKKRLEGLCARVEKMELGVLGEVTDDFQGTDDAILPAPCQVNWEDFSIGELESLSSLDSFNDDVFAKWRTADLPMMFAAGFLGTLSSVALRNFFAQYHDRMGRIKTEKGGHSGEYADWVPGKKQPGGFGHRWEHGHDLLNPFEIDWKQYMEIAKETGGPLPRWMQAAFYWFRHLYHDTFSKEGLPLPGHSLLRDYLNPVKNRELLQVMGTLKARDMAGSVVTNAIMGGYLWGTEGDLKRVLCKPNYRAFSLMLGANITNILCGLLAPPPFTSLNWSSVPIVGYYGWQIIRLEKEVREALGKRDSVLMQNDEILANNYNVLKTNDGLISNMSTQMERFEADVERYYGQVIMQHDKLTRRVLKD